MSEINGAPKCIHIQLSGACVLVPDWSLILGRGEMQNWGGGGGASQDFLLEEGEMGRKS